MNSKEEILRGRSIPTIEKNMHESLVYLVLHNSDIKAIEKPVKKDPLDQKILKEVNKQLEIFLIN